VRLSELGELGLLYELEQRGLVMGIENDVAELDGGRIVTQDALVEDVHFRLDWISWHELGFRAAAVNISDLSAAGADPDGLVVSLGLPDSAELESVVELYEGIAEAGVPVLGGDTTAAERVYLSVTAIGRSGRVPGRTGAQPGDLIVVTGPLGGAGAAFREQRFIRPPIRTEEGKSLAETAHAMLDISDGLEQDLGHLAGRSGVRCVIELERVPLAEGATIEDLGFGEEYELLAALPFEAFDVIGRCEEGEGVELLRYGVPVELGGWEHFT
jgi:thiamine-monophosphate kinase